MVEMSGKVLKIQFYPNSIAILVSAPQKIIKTYGAMILQSIIAQEITNVLYFFVHVFRITYL